MECEMCGSDQLRFVAVESREPHGEMHRHEGYRCLNCGATQMSAPESSRSRSSEDLIGDLMRSIVIARNLDPKFRLGVALALSDQKKEVA